MVRGRRSIEDRGRARDRRSGLVVKWWVYWWRWVHASRRVNSWQRVYSSQWLRSGGCSRSDRCTIEVGGRAHLNMGAL